MDRDSVLKHLTLDEVPDLLWLIGHLERVGDLSSDEVDTWHRDIQARVAFLTLDETATH